MFKDFVKVIIKKRVTIIYLVFMFFALGFLASNTYNNLNSEYEIAFKSEANITQDNVNVNANKIVQENEKYHNINIYLMISNNDIKLSKEAEQYKIGTKCNYYDNFFSSKGNVVKTRAESFLKDLVLSLDANAQLCYDTTIIELGKANNIIVGAIFTGTGVVSYCIYLFINKSRLLSGSEHNINEHPYFSGSYWKNSLKSFKSIKSITNIALLFALMMIMKLFSIPTGFANLRISLVYLFFALISLLYGPITGFIVGTLSDTLGFLLFPNGSFFFLGYTLSAALTGVIYALCLHKKKITFANCFLARFLVNIFINVILGSIWWGIISSYSVHTTLIYMCTYILPKNLIFLVPQSILLYFFLRAISPVLLHFHLIDNSLLPKKIIKKDNEKCTN